MNTVIADDLGSAIGRELIELSRYQYMFARLGAGCKRRDIFVWHRIMRHISSSQHSASAPATSSGATPTGGRPGGAGPGCPHYFIG